MAKYLGAEIDGWVKIQVPTPNGKQSTWWLVNPADPSQNVSFGIGGQVPAIVDENTVSGNPSQFPTLFTLNDNNGYSLSDIANEQGSKVVGGKRVATSDSLSDPLGTGSTETSLSDTQTRGGAGGTTGGPTGDISSLLNSAEFKSLSADDQSAVQAVFEAIVANDPAAASRLAGAFSAATKIADPFFAQQIRLAADAINRGFVSIDQEEAFKEEQLRNSLKDLQTYIANKQQFLSLEEANVLRGIERSFEQALDTTRQNLAATGFGSSTRRTQKETILGEEREDLVESTERRFGFQQEESRLGLERGERDVSADIERLTQLAQEGRLDLLRQGEEQLGSAGLGNLPGLAGEAPIGDIFGTIPQQRQADIIAGTRNLLF